MVESVHGNCDFVISNGREVSGFGEVLSDQAVGVFVGSTLPGSVGMSEIHIGLEIRRDGFAENNECLAPLQSTTEKYILE